jgi:preprotein translocase subunit SecE
LVTEAAICASALATGSGREVYFSQMAKTNPFEFLQEVRAETAKVTWPSRNETVITTIMVIVMAIVASIFFLLADSVMNWGVGLLLGLGR